MDDDEKLERRLASEREFIMHSLAKNIEAQIQPPVMEKQPDPDGVVLSGNVLKTSAVVFALLSTIITAVFAFTQKADRSEIVKLQKQVEDQRVELTTVKAQSSIALQTIKEIRDDFKELRRDIKEIRKALRGIK